MPNWSYNVLRVKGSTENLKEFYDVAIKKNENGDNSFRLSNIFPMPEKIKNTISPSSSAKGRKWINNEVSDLRDGAISEVLDEEVKLIPCENNTEEKCKELIELYGADNWYDWNVNNYGTKWDAESEGYQLQMDDEEMIADFQTAWSPPEIFLEKLIKLFPNLDVRLSYELEGGECGLYQTIKDDDETYLDHEAGEMEYYSYDGEILYLDHTTGQVKYKESDEICEEYDLRNPFDV